MRVERIHPALLRDQRLDVAVVIDVLRATSTAVVLAARGVDHLVVVATGGEMNRLAPPKSGRYLVFSEIPSVSANARLPLGLRDLAITAGFLALFVLSRRWFFSRFKPVLNLPHTGH